jgi:hypothetical protein
MKHAAWRLPKLEEFWRFVAARHDVFIKRVIDQDPPPWTDDPALAGAHYTNVYRELDRVTRHLITRVLEPTKEWPPEDRLFQVLFYRAFNLPETYDVLDAVGLAGQRWRPKDVERVLLKRVRAGHKVFTGAFLVNGLESSAKGGQARWSRPGGKTSLWVDRLTRIYHGRRALMLELRIAEAKRRGLDLRAAWLQAHRALTRLPGFGAFLAYEVLVDLCYDPAVLTFSENDWVNVGPGAKKGLAYMLRQPPDTWEVPLIYLWRHQQAYQEQAKARVQGPRLTLRNVEHCLCEYSKYRRMKLGVRPKRTYQLARQNDDLSPWKNLSPAYWTFPK